MKYTYDNFIFDLYGTLIDVNTDEHAAQTWKKWCRYLDRKGIKHPHYIPFRRRFFEMDRAYRERAKLEGPYEVPEIDIIEVYRELFEAYGNGILSDELLLDISYQFRVCSRAHIRLYPGVIEFLDQLKAEGKHAYLLSNAQASYTMPEIQMLSLDEKLEDIFISSDEKCMKPDVAFFDKLICKHGLNKTKTVMVGDTLSSDVAGAKKAGIDAIHLVGENAASCFYINAVQA